MDLRNMTDTALWRLWQHYIHQADLIRVELARRDKRALKKQRGNNGF